MERTDNKRRLDPAKTRETILTAALMTFAERGFAGASIGDIASAAGVQKSLVQYHYGSKEELWHACIAHRLSPLVGIIERFAKGEADVAEVVTARFRAIQQHPEMSRLISWVCLTPVPIPSIVQERLKPIVHQMQGSLGDSKLMSLLQAFAAMDGWFQHRNLYRRVIGEAVMDRALEEKVLEGVLRMVGER